MIVERADRVNSRRLLANIFFLTVNTMLVTVLTALVSKLEVSLTRLSASIWISFIIFEIPEQISRPSVTYHYFMNKDSYY